MQPVSYRKICAALISNIPERHQEVLGLRFGLAGQNPETLEAVGGRFGITRERVRQIEADALGKVKKAMQGGVTPTHKALDAIYKEWEGYLRGHGNLRSEQSMLVELASPETAWHVRFLFSLGNAFKRVKETDNTYAFWTCDFDSINIADQVLSSFVSAFNKLGHTVEEKDILALYKDHVKSEQKIALSDKAVFSYLDISKLIACGPHGVWGLREWPEITPRGLRDRAYLVYKKEGRPLHFTEVARLISQLGFIDKSKTVLCQSVHNDLIRDSRFVLVGRGMYALREWGYEPGTVREVIESMLKNIGKPLTENEIVNQILKQRQVKASTVSLNLQNKAHFVRTSDGKYALKTQLA